MHVSVVPKSPANLFWLREEAKHWPKYHHNSFLLSHPQTDGAALPVLNILWQNDKFPPKHQTQLLHNPIHEMPCCHDRCRTLQEERDRLQQRVKQLEDGIVNEHVRRLIETRRQEEEEKLRRTSAEQIASAREAYRTQFASEMESARQRRETEAKQLEAQRAQAAADYAVVRGEMGDDLTKLVQLLQGQMDKWQKALDGSECRMLAQSYAALHGLWTKALARVIVDAQFTSADEVVMNGLVQLHGDLRDRLVQLEQAMLRLGLTVIRPEAGEPFDGVYHVPAGTSAGAVGESRITRCLHPGVMAQSGEVLIRAEVELG